MSTSGWWGCRFSLRFDSLWLAEQNIKKNCFFDQTDYNARKASLIHSLSGCLTPTRAKDRGDGYSPQRKFH